jgi:hypothetical protein
VLAQIRKISESEGENYEGIIGGRKISHQEAVIAPYEIQLALF